jgi:Uma2 family endonuclease
MASVLDDPGIGIARFSVERYHQMIRSGILTEDDRLELFEGLLVDKMTEGPAHAAQISMLARIIAAQLGMNDWMLRVQHPITTPDSEPEPDLAIVRTGRYTEAHPGPADIAVVIEVADSSLSRDRSIKMRIYAAAGIERYLLINLAGHVVEVYGNPTADPEPRYATSNTLIAGPVDLGPISVDAAKLLNPF